MENVIYNQIIDNKYIGVITILDDLDTNPKTVTFDVKAGLGTYAIVAK